MFKLCSHSTTLFSSPWPSVICRKFHSSPVLFANAKVCHYEVLGISKTASPNDVKKAYLQKAREHHPDLNKDSPHANQKFIEISKAYEILKDSSSRTDYDYEIRHTTRTESYTRRPSPGESYSSNPNRRNSMFVEEDEDIFGEEGEIEFDEADFAGMNFDEAFNIDLSNLFRMAGVRMGGGGGGRMHSFRMNSKFAGGMNGFNIHNVMDALHRHQMRQKQKRKTMQNKQQAQRQKQQQQTQHRQGPSNTKQQSKKYSGEDGEERVKGSKKQTRDAQSWYDFSNQQGKKSNNNNSNNNSNNNNQNNKNTNSKSTNNTNNNNNNNNNNTKSSKKFTEDFDGIFKKSSRMSKQEKQWWEKTTKMFYNKKKR